MEFRRVLHAFSANLDVQMAVNIGVTNMVGDLFKLSLARRGLHSLSFEDILSQMEDKDWLSSPSKTHQLDPLLATLHFLSLVHNLTYTISTPLFYLYAIIRWEGVLSCIPNSTCIYFLEKHKLITTLHPQSHPCCS